MQLGTPPLQERAELVAWSKHWSKENQHTVAQKFFSLYRKAVFARTVQYFVNHYFPPQGILVEAGSGTAETSMRINKFGGTRKLIAVDIVLPVLEHCHPVMDSRLCGDIFRLPFGNSSVDGIWNVGVMEHFTHEQIDQIMREFHRLLKEDACLIMLWPGVDSIPQRMLRVMEKAINLRMREDKFQFHPDEISQIKSLREGRQVLTRNGFRVLEVEYGLRSLFAFKTLVGKKRST
jgi:SAM-dependent methyltransferase